MKFKIGFMAKAEKNETMRNQENEKVIEPSCKSESAKKSVVEIFFLERHLTCSYYNDMFDLKLGDIVYVEGKLEGMRGRVVAVNYNFKIKLSDYKRVIGIVDTNIVGRFFMAGSHFITTDNNALNYNKVITWFRAPLDEDEEFISSYDDSSFYLNDLGNIKTDISTAEKGKEYYTEGHVQYIELKEGKGRAIVLGRKPYEVEFNYNGGEISRLVCDCYCTGICKHELAVCLALKEILELTEKEYPDIDPSDYLAVINKTTFFEYAVNTAKNGTFTMM